MTPANQSQQSAQDRKSSPEGSGQAEPDYRVTFERANVAIAHASAEGRFLRVNRRLCEMLGYEESALVGETIARFTHDEDIAISRRMLEQVRLGELADATYSKRYVRNDGRTIWADLSVAPVRKPSGEVEYFVAVVQDVTPRREAEALLRLEHAVASALYQPHDPQHSLQAAIRAVCVSQGWEFGRYWKIDAAGGVLRAGEHWSIPSAEIDRFLERSKSRAFGPGMGGIGAAWQTGEPVWVTDISRDERLLQPDFAHEAGMRTVIVLPVGSPSGTLGVLVFARRDIREPDALLLRTAKSIGNQVGQHLERKVADEALRRFRVALDNSADMILLIDRESMRYMDVNETACRLLGYTREELTSMGPQDVLPASREDLERAYDELAADPSIKSGMHSYYRCKDGATLPFESTRHVLRSGNGFLIAAVSRDIRERLAAEQTLRESERFAKMTLDALRKHICVLDEGGRIIAVNRAWREFAIANGGVPEKVLEGVSYIEVCEAASGEEAVQMAAGVRFVLAGSKREFTMEYPCHSPTEQRWFEARVARFADDGPVRVVISHVNITARVIAAEKIRRHAMQQGLIADFGQLALDGTGLPELQDQAVFLAGCGLGVDFCRLLRVAPDRQSLMLEAGTGWDEGWVGSHLNDFEERSQHRYVLDQREAIVVEELCTETRFVPSQMLTAHGIVSGVEVPLGSGNGGDTIGVFGAFSRERREFSPEDADFLRSLANTLESAAERRRAEERLVRFSQFDALTDLPNRSLFRDRLTQTVTQAGRNGWLTGVLAVGLDRFKTVNDTLGHGGGDRLLKMVAERLAQSVRPGDTVARLGGDIFAITLANLARSDDAGLVAQKVLAACATAFTLDGNDTYLSASIGIALAPDDGPDADALLKSADIALYRAKERERNCYQYFLPEMQQRAAARLRNEADLRGALQRSEFVLHYQPKADLYDGRISGFEALLRWQHPTRGLVPPFEFISILEDTGLIVPVGEWVVREVCAQIGRWQDQGLATRPVAINLSARQFQQKDLETVLGALIDGTGVDPRLLEFELTESLLMKDAEEAVRVLTSLKARGVRLSVDDFGTGYSSLAYLKRFPLDSLKIDRAFIRDCTTDADDATIALSIINLAHNLKLKVVAEGVETEAQLNFLRSRGCDQMQGYFFARPMDAEAATAALSRGLRLEKSTVTDAGTAMSVLLVDDNPDDLEIFRETLSDDGYRILVARTPHLALESLATERVDIVISDHRMPSMTGVDFLAAVSRLYPAAIRVMLTGSDSPNALSDAVNQAHIHKYLSKHWDDQRLRAEVREACRLARARGAANE